MGRTLKETRKLTVDAVKREMIRSAAKKLFADNGLDGTSVREIARLAGYTTGAIYFHYANKEELYADILRDSLDRLFVVTTHSSDEKADPVDRLVVAFRALVGFYEKHPRDLDLSLYLLKGARPRGLTPALNKELNEKLRLILNVFRHELSRAGVEEARLNDEVGVLFDEMMGCLVAANTGRLKVIGTSLAKVVDVHTANLSQRLSMKKP